MALSAVSSVRQVGRGPMDGVPIAGRWKHRWERGEKRPRGAFLKRLPTPCPHSAPSRPHPHRFCNNDSWERQHHRHQPVPGLLRHPRKSVDGIVQSIPVGVPRGNARNNSVWVRLGALVTAEIRRSSTHPALNLAPPCLLCCQLSLSMITAASTYLWLTGSPGSPTS